MDEMIAIPKDQYKELIRDQNILQAMYFNGVSSWSGYNHAMSEAEDTAEDEDEDEDSIYFDEFSQDDDKDFYELYREELDELDIIGDDDDI